MEKRVLRSRDPVYDRHISEHPRWATSADRRGACQPCAGDIGDSAHASALDPHTPVHSIRTLESREHLYVHRRYTSISRLWTRTITILDSKVLVTEAAPAPEEAPEQNGILTTEPAGGDSTLEAIVAKLGLRVALLEEQQENLHQTNVKVEQELAIYRAGTKELAKLQTSFMPEAAKPRSKRTNRTSEQRKQHEHRRVQRCKQQEQQQHRDREPPRNAPWPTVSIAAEADSSTGV
uniref:Uncharacterized protein n=1 Tax=Anopheles farauti TaxID=69004 RepID=A0A182QTN7_9DIPT